MQISGEGNYTQGPYGHFFLPLPRKGREEGSFSKKERSPFTPFHVRLIMYTLGLGKLKNINENFMLLLDDKAGFNAQHDWEKITLALKEIPEL